MARTQEEVEANARLKAPELLERVRERLKGCACREGWAQANKRQQCGDCDADEQLIAEIEG